MINKCNGFVSYYNNTDNVFDLSQTVRLQINPNVLMLVLPIINASLQLRVFDICQNRLKVMPVDMIL